MTTQTTRVRWDDLDANGHAGNTSFSAYANDARLNYLAEHGFTVTRLQELRIGPIGFSEALAFHRELFLGDQLQVSVEIAALSQSRHRWTMRHEIRRDGELAGTVELAGAWLSLDTRRVVSPPAKLADALAALPRTGDFTQLPASTK